MQFLIQSNFYLFLSSSALSYKHNEYEKVKETHSAIGNLLNQNSLREMVQRNPRHLYKGNTLNEYSIMILSKLLTSTSYIRMVFEFVNVELKMAITCSF